MERQRGCRMSLWFWLAGVIANPVCSAVVSTMTGEKMWSLRPATLWLGDGGEVPWSSEGPPTPPGLLSQSLGGSGAGESFCGSSVGLLWYILCYCWRWGILCQEQEARKKIRASSICRAPGKTQQNRKWNSHLPSWCSYQSQNHFQLLLLSSCPYFILFFLILSRSPS